VDVPVVGGGPAAYFSTLPIKAALAALQQTGIDAHISQTAGTYVCNHVFYALMDMAGRHDLSFRGGFLHIPYLPEQAAQLGGAPSMSADDIVRGIEIVLSISAARTNDVRTAEGRLS